MRESADVTGFASGDGLDSPPCSLVRTWLSVSRFDLSCAIPEKDRRLSFFSSTVADRDDPALEPWIQDLNFPIPLRVGNQMSRFKISRVY